MENTRANATKFSNRESSPFTVPQISLPKGGGAIRGIGEKFTANAPTGTASLTVPIYTSPGRSSFGPQPSLSYDSGSGNTTFGFGWSLTLPSITRKTDKGLPQYEDAQESDTFVLSGAEDLMPALVQSGGQWTRDIIPDREVYGNHYAIHRYRPRVEGLFARIEHWINLSASSDSFWRSISKDNITTWYGKTAESRIADPADPSRIFTWLICQTHDDKGNVIGYTYKSEDSTGVDLSQVHERNRTGAVRSANRYIKNVVYGNRTPYFPDLSAASETPLPTDWCFELVFDYGEHDPSNPTPQEIAPWTCRLDPFSTYRPTFEVRTYRLCRRALMFHHFPDASNVGMNCLVRSTDLTHAPQVPPADPSQPFYSYLLSISQSGFTRDGNGGYISASLPPLEFQYTQSMVEETVQHVDPASLQNLPCGLDGSSYRWVDLDGEGLSGILTEQEGAWFYKANLSPVNRQTVNGVEYTLPKFAEVEIVGKQPSPAALNSGRQQLLSLSGDGQLDLVDFERPTPGYFERTGNANWQPFVPFQSLPVVDWQNPELRFVDLTGDGFADMLLSEADDLCWYKSLSNLGFATGKRVPQAYDEEEGPRFIFADSTESVFLTDMSGDGLSDLVRIRNGEVCYWPNLGYGRFGAKVTMDNSPLFDRPDLFDARKLRLADIDGSGTSDIIYLTGRSVELYFNQSGNGWGAARVLNHFPAVESVSSVSALDLLGRGTACLVWSSPLPGNASQPMRYIDLMGGQKPHLLTNIVNNLGAETVIRYAPSTKFYVQDKLAGTPWVTRLPFPVQVVEEVKTYDWISRNLFITKYAYHHGYYDGVEREFRGFGRVDQWDTEEYATLENSANFPKASNIDTASNVPPVYTKTWFHTGAYLGEVAVSRYMEEEYYDEGDSSEAVASLTPAQLESMLLDDTPLPSDILLSDGTRLAYNFSPEELREACRALRGFILRQEIFALDATDESDRPYVVSERNYTIEALQPQGPNQYGVFFSHPRETVDFHYERQLFKVSGNTIVDSGAPPPAVTAADPRVTHSLTLATDPFGNILQSVTAAYGRRYLDPNLSPADQSKQSSILLTYAENTYTNAVAADDAYRIPLSAQESTHELLQVQPAASQSHVTNLFNFEDLETTVQALADGSHDILYENLYPTGLTPNQGYRRLIAQTRTYYRPDDMGAAAGDPKALLPLGALESLALPGATYKLAYTPGLISQVYQRSGAALMPTPDAVLGSTTADGGGYVDLDGDGNWWMPSGRVYYSPTPPASPQERNEALLDFFLVRRVEDPFANASAVDYETNNLLVATTTDPVLNVVTATNDYRVLAPVLVTDPNGNQTAFAFDALGLVAATALMGKQGQNLGDLLSGFSADLTQAQIDAFYGVADPHTLAAPLLGNATSRVVYDVNRFANSQQAAPADPTKWQPAFAAMLAREIHVSDLQSGQQSPIQITFSYSDGFGRAIQKKIQAEPGPVIDSGPTVNPRWVGTGWIIFNNKGKPVRQYEPFFSQLPSQGHQFEFGAIVGVSSILIYDPIGRVIATLHPNQTYEKVIFDPWQQFTWDVNDTVLITNPATDPDVGGFFQRLPATDYSPTWYTQRSGGALGSQEQSAATKAAAHANTPQIAYFDTLGRSFLTIEGNGASGKYLTHVELDIQSYQRSITDALNRKVVVYDYDLPGRRIHQSGIEAGERWTLNDVTGSAVRGWDSRGHNFRSGYDGLRRPLNFFVLGTDAQNSDTRTTAAEVLYEKIDYGEGQPNDQPLNLRTRIYQRHDPVGMAIHTATDPVTKQTIAYDFKGNLLASSRQFVTDYKALPDWSKAAPAFLPDVFVSRTQYDALNRIVTATTPDGSVAHPTYNPANLLETVSVNLLGATVSTSFVTNIDYDAKAQRVLIDYGNKTSTTYSYDPFTSHLTNLTTSRPGFPANQQTVQDLSYTYDPVGNITHIQDDADTQSVIFFSNQRVEPSADYTYDPIYRLIQATGREQLGLSGGVSNPPWPSSYNDVPRVQLPHPGDGKAMGTYTEQFQYDAAGNLLACKHHGTTPINPGWTRSYTYNEPSLLEPGEQSNRLSSTTVSGSESLNEPYTYDLHGSMTSMPQLQAMIWNFKEELLITQRQAVNPSDSDGILHKGERTYYVYDGAGQRARKTTESATGTKIKERFYLGPFEVYREYDGAGNVKFQRQTLHIMDDKRRVAIVETVTVSSGAPQGAPTSPVIRYQLDNHLGSACLELDDSGAVITYEEYYPYGSTSYQAGRTAAEVSLKRYRYTGKERDEETGLSYHGARYYANWLGRWTAPDPLGVNAGVNLYIYVKNNPIGLIDPGGKQETPPKKEPSWWDVAKAVASMEFTSATGQTPEQFGRGMLDKARSITVDPVMRLYGPNGMIDKAAQKMVDKATGVDKPDDAYVSAEEHQQYLRDIVTVGGGLFPGFGDVGAAGQGPSLATPNGLVVQSTADATTATAPLNTTVVYATRGGSAVANRPNPPKPKEPGKWENDMTAGQNMSPEQAKYQKQVTGQRDPSKTYHVNGRSFDGYEPGKGGQPGTLVEAKHLGDEGRFAKAYENMTKGNFSDSDHLMDRAGNLLQQGKNQVQAAAGTGARIEWRVSGQKAADALKLLFENNPVTKGKIDVVYVPLKP